LAAEVMIELLRNYTADDGKQAKDDAKRCIISAIADPKTFLFEPLLSLTPVISLQNSPLHELLLIFVSGNLTNYLDFYKGHKDLIKSLGTILLYIILSEKVKCLLHFSLFNIKKVNLTVYYIQFNKQLWKSNNMLRRGFTH